MTGLDWVYPCIMLIVWFAVLVVCVWYNGRNL
jgi:hypothetical protein